MQQNGLGWSLVTAIVTVAASLAYLLTGGLDLRLGLDLQGGIAAVYTPVFDGDRPADFDEAIDDTIENIRRRIDSLGVAEPEIARQGDDILVQLPGLDDPERAQEVIGATAELTFREVIREIAPGDPAYNESPDCLEITGLAADESGVVCDGAELDQYELLANDPELIDELTATADELEPEPSDDAPEADGADSDADAEATDDATEAANEDAASEDPQAMRAVASVQAQTDEPATDDDAGAAADAGADTDTAATGDDATGEDDTELPPPPDLPADILDQVTADELDILTVFQPRKYEVSEAVIDGERVTDAFAQTQLGNAWDVVLEFDNEGGDAFAEFSSRLACQRDGELPGSGTMAIVVDNRVESAAGMNSSVPCGVGIRGGSSNISMGGGDPETQRFEAETLAIVLKAGSLPLTLEPSTFNEVSPTLGAESLNAGLLAGLIGLGLVAIYLIGFYRLLGVIAILGLSIFGVLMLTIISLLGRAGFTLTLAGIVGIIVSVGITADSSIIFFERLRDEVRAGKSVRAAAGGAFSNAFGTNLTGNMVTLAAAAVLYVLAVGSVRGFALTLGIATMLDIFILGTFTRGAVGLVTRRQLVTRKSLRVPPRDPAPTSTAEVRA